jgi:hypothetical protein
MNIIAYSKMVYMASFHETWYEFRLLENILLILHHHLTLYGLKYSNVQ